MQKSEYLRDLLNKHSKGPVNGVFTDGSCEGNPGPGGWGCVWVEEDEIVEERCGSDPDTTNNRMELRALIEAYKLIPENDPIMIYSDSQLCVNTLNQWAAGWEKRGWKRKTGPIANLELVQEAYVLYKTRPLATLKWIKAHDGSRWNEYADGLATEYTRR